jgi:hypothetical protein
VVRRGPAKRLRREQISKCEPKAALLLSGNSFGGRRGLVWRPNSGEGRIMNRRHTLLLAVSVLALTSGGAVHAQAAPAPVEKELREALRNFEQTWDGPATN